MDTSFLQGLAQLETRDGAKSIKGPNGEDSNNLFNIKDNSGKGFRAFDKAEGSHDAYRTYDSRESSIQDLVSLLQRRYPDAHAALTQGGTAEQFATALAKGGYATDPQYASKLSSVINGVQRTQATSQLDSLRAAGWGADIDAAQQNGWKPGDIAKRLNDTQAEHANTVAQMVQSGSAPAAIMQQLGNSPVVQKLMDAGASPDEIVTKVGGQSLQKVKDAQAKVDGQGFGTNLYRGAINAAQDVSTGAKQIAATVTGNDARLQQLNAEEATRQADPTYQAQGNTVGSMLGGGAVKALPYVGAALVPEVSIPGMIAMQGGVGALSGALKPTTGDGQRLGNIGTEAALAAGGAGAGALIGKVVGAMTGKMLGGTPEDAARVAQLTSDAQAQGLPINAATLSKPDGFWRGVADSMQKNGPLQGFQAKADQAVASKVAEGLGLPSYAGPIDTELLQAATPGIKAGLDNATNVTVTLPKTLQAELAPMVNGSTNPLTEGIATNSVVKRAVANLLAAADSGTPVAGRSLQELNSELKALAQTQGVSASERQMAGQLIGKINTTLTDAMTPEQAAAFKAANGQYANLMAVQKMVSASGDSGVVTPRQMINAVKTGRFKNAFYAGDAPYQELAGAASDLYGPAAGKGLGSILAKTVGGHNEGLHAAALMHPVAGIPALIAKKAGSALLGKLAASENPAVIRMLTGGKGIDPATIASIAKALGNTGAIAAQ